MGLYSRGGGGYQEPPPIPYKDSGEFFNYKTNTEKNINDSVVYGGISYDPPTKKWNKVLEKVDYPTYFPASNYTKTVTKTRYVQDYEENEDGEIIGPAYETNEDGEIIGPRYKTNWDGELIEEEYQVEEIDTEKNEAIDAYHNELKTKHKKLNAQNVAKNNAYNTTETAAFATKGSDYTNQRAKIRNLGDIDDTLKNRINKWSYGSSLT